MLDKCFFMYYKYKCNQERLQKSTATAGFKRKGFIMSIYEKMDVIVRTHDTYIDSVNEKINTHAISTDAFRKEIIKAVNAFDSELTRQDNELQLLATSELEEDMTSSFSYNVIEYYRDKYEKFLKYLND